MPQGKTDRRFSGGRRCTIPQRTSYRVNEAIRAPKVQLIGPNGENLGVVSRAEALRRAAEANLDLVEVAPNANPPVCRIMDYGKFLYEKKKKARERKRPNRDIKEMRLRPRTALHDRNIKIREAREWLEAGHKVRVVVLFRGREITYPELALNNLKEIAQELADLARVEVPPRLEGRRMVMVLAPSRKK